jgi:hypothetical protein
MAGLRQGANPKRRGRPATGRGQTIGVRMLPGLLGPLDRYIADRGAGSSRPETIRAIVEDWLIGHGYLGAGEKSLRPEELNAENDG